MLSARLRNGIPRLVLCALIFAGLLPLSAQEAAKPVTFLGTVQTLSGNTITVKSDAGATMQVTVQENARLLRIEPGQKTLAGASPFSLTDLQTGDRVMARGSAGADGKHWLPPRWLPSRAPTSLRNSNRSGKTGRNVAPEAWLRRLIQLPGRSPFRAGPVAPERW